MPISFQAPDAYAPGVSYQAGAIGRMDQDRQQAIEIQREAARQYFQARQDEQAQQHLDQQQSQHEDLLGQRQEEFAAGQEPSARDLWHSADRVKQMQAQADVHRLTQDQEWTAADDREKKKKESTIAYIMNDPTLDPVEKRDSIFQIKTGLDPLVQRFKAAQAKNLQAQEELRTQQAAKALAMTTNAEKVRGMKIPERIFRDEYGGLHVLQPDGSTTHVAPPVAKAPSERLVEFSARDQAALMKIAAERAKLVTNPNIPGAKGAPMPLSPEQMAAQTDFEYERLKDEWHREHAKHAARGIAVDAAGGGLPPGMAPPAGATPPSPMAPPGDPSRGAAMAAAPAFTGPPTPPPAPPRPMAGVDPKEWTPVQAKVHDEFEKMRNLFDTRTPNGRAGAAEVARAAAIFRRWGSLPAMPPDERKRYEDSVNAAERLKLAK